MWRIRLWHVCASTDGESSTISRMSSCSWTISRRSRRRRGAPPSSRSSISSRSDRTSFGLSYIARDILTTLGSTSRIRRHALVEHRRRSAHRAERRLPPPHGRGRRRRQAPGRRRGRGRSQSPAPQGRAATGGVEAVDDVAGELVAKHVEGKGLRTIAAAYSSRRGSRRRRVRPHGWPWLARSPRLTSSWRFASIPVRPCTPSFGRTRRR